jgi:hypothetical protein
MVMILKHYQTGGGSLIVSTNSKINNNNDVSIKRKKSIFTQIDEQEATDRVREFHKRLVPNAFKSSKGYDKYQLAPKGEGDTERDIIMSACYYLSLFISFSLLLQG